MKIIDKFLDTNDFTDLKNTLTSDKFPWYLNHGVSYAGDDSGILFTHLVYKDNEFNSSFTLGGLDIFKEKLGIVSLVRAKFNLLHRTDKIIEHQPHIDIPNPPDNLKTAILYLNTNNGYTKFENGEVVKSVRNRLVTFPAHLKYADSTCTDEEYRCIINLNYYK